MSSGIEILVKSLMRAVGVPNNPVELVDRLLEDKGYTREQIIEMGFQVRDLALDYHRRLAQIELLLAALCANAGLSVIPQLEKPHAPENSGDGDGRSENRRRNARDDGAGTVDG